MEISEQKRQFVTKYDEHKIMDEIKKYTENLSNIDLKNLGLQKKNETIENLSTSLFEQVSQNNFDYCLLGVKIGVKLILELLI